MEAKFSSLAFGDGQATIAGSDTDPYHYAIQDYDAETNTDHAQFRQYSITQGRWLSPDPYLGSYDFANPQSLNRYSYVTNDPVAFMDPLGLARNCDFITLEVPNTESGEVTQLQQT